MIFSLKSTVAMNIVIINQTFIFIYHRMSILIGRETIVKDEDLIWWLDRITELEEQNKKLKSERDKWRGKYNRLKSEFNLLKNKIWTTKK